MARAEELQKCAAAAAARARARNARLTRAPAGRLCLRTLDLHKSGLTPNHGATATASALPRTGSGKHGEKAEDGEKTEARPRSLLAPAAQERS